MRFLYVNPRSGLGRGSLIAQEAERRGIRVLELGDEAPAGASAVGVAGGDGSLAGVAQVALERDLPFVCVPCGTRNHFARDAGLVLDDPVAALGAYDGVERRVDVGEVADRLFLNNVSLGAYALYQHGLLGELFDRRRRDAVVDGEPVHAAILLVSNNVYDRRGRRARLDAGVLGVYATAGLLPKVAIERTAPGFELELPNLQQVEAAIDGEAVTLPSRLTPKVRPAALRLLVPPEP
jgi:diacylglycerol kinase family enzyme